MTAGAGVGTRAMSWRRGPVRSKSARGGRTRPATETRCDPLSRSEPASRHESQTLQSVRPRGQARAPRVRSRRATLARCCRVTRARGGGGGGGVEVAACWTTAAPAYGPARAAPSSSSECARPRMRELLGSETRSLANKVPRVRGSCSVSWCCLVCTTGAGVLALLRAHAIVRRCLCAGCLVLVLVRDRCATICWMLLFLLAGIRGLSQASLGALGRRHGAVAPIRSPTAPVTP